MTRSERQRARAQIKAARKAARDAQIANMSDREKTVWSVGCLGALVLAIAGIVSLFSGSKSDTPGSNPNNVALARPSECPASSTPRDVTVTGEAVVLTSPSKNAPPLTRTVGGETLPATIDASVAVREQCQSGGWSLIRVLGPQELREWQGWVPGPYLAAVPLNGSGRRIYRAADFDWPRGSKPEQAALLKVINRIVDERPDCEAIDTRSLVANGAGAARHYSVGCFGPNGETAFDFTAADTTSGRSFAPVDPLGKMAPIETCKRAILTRASHPSTVVFPSLDYDQRDGGNGDTQLLMSFKAKNGFNLELEYDAQCDFRGSDLTDVVLSEAGR